MFEGVGREDEAVGQSARKFGVMEDLRCCHLSDTPTSSWRRQLNSVSGFSKLKGLTYDSHTLLAVQGRSPDNNNKKLTGAPITKKSARNRRRSSFDHGLLPRDGSAGIIFRIGGGG